jgi:hypothetical protein
LELPDLPETTDTSGAYPRLTDEQIMLLSQYGARKRLARGCTLFCEGDRECGLFVVLGGRRGGGSRGGGRPAGVRHPTRPDPRRDLEGADGPAQPSTTELAELLGLREYAPPRDAYDVLVVGAGPAGVAAAVTAASDGLSTVVLDAIATGGQAGTSSQIENHLGFPAASRAPSSPTERWSRPASSAPLSRSLARPDRSTASTTISSCD